MLMMRAKLIPVLIGALAIISAAQTPSDNKSPNDVTVVSFEWKYSGYKRAESMEENNPLPTGGVPSSYKAERTISYVFKYMTKATLKNRGAKTIKAISWEYVFADPESGKEIKRFKIQSAQQIQPGATETLTKEIGLSPKENTRSLNSGRQSVTITRIEYTDGSVWRR
jgi:hypothetical protein